MSAFAAVELVGLDHISPTKGGEAGKPRDKFISVVQVAKSADRRSGTSWQSHLLESSKADAGATDMEQMAYAA